MLKINSDLFRTLVLTILAGLAVLIVSLSNRDVYSKEIVDVKFEAVEERVEHMEEDVRWIVRTMGGTPSAETNENSNSSQSD